MAFSYSPGSTSRLHRLRVIIGDTNASNPLRQDEELLEVLGRTGDKESGLYFAAAEVFDQLLAQFAPEADRVDRDQEGSVEWRQRISTWQLLSRNARTRAAEIERQELAVSRPPAQPEAGRMPVDVGWIR